MKKVVFQPAFPNSWMAHVIKFNLDVYFNLYIFDHLIKQLFKFSSFKKFESIQKSTEHMSISGN